MKKPELDKTKLSNYRPIFQLPFLANLLAMIVYKQLITYLSTYYLLDIRYTYLRQGHSTKQLYFHFLKTFILTITYTTLLIFYIRHTRL